MDEAGLSVHSAANQLGHVKPRCLHIWTGRNGRAPDGRGARRSFPALSGWAQLTVQEPRPESSAPGVLALIGLLLQPSLDGLPAVPHMATNPIADWAVALGPPAVQGVNRYAQHLRDVRERHQPVTGLECHDHPLSVASASKQVLVLPKSRCGWRAIIRAVQRLGPIVEGGVFGARYGGCLGLVAPGAGAPGGGR